MYVVIGLMFFNICTMFAIYIKRRRISKDKMATRLTKSHLHPSGVLFVENQLDLCELDTTVSDNSMVSEIPENTVNEAGKLLNDGTLAERFRALFILRNAKTDNAVQWIAKTFNDSSELLKHELAYCLGQMQNPSAIPYLTDNLEPIVRHEAAEALGAIGDPSTEIILQKYLSDKSIVVAQTCELAIRRIKWQKEHLNGIATSLYNSVVPAASSTNVKELCDTLIDESKLMWDRYRAMFALRNINSDESILALTKGLECKSSSLFRHEIAYVLGQIQSPLSIQQLSKNLKDPKEAGMVRHECAEALGSIAKPECDDLLKEYVLDKERVVRESCEVALDMAKHEKDNEFQYAKIS